MQSVPRWLFEAACACLALGAVFGSIALTFWIGKMLPERKRRVVLFNIPPTGGPSVPAVSYHERVVDLRVTGDPPVDPMLTDPIDPKPKDLRS